MRRSVFIAIAALVIGLMSVTEAITANPARASLTQGSPVPLASGLTDVKLDGISIARDGTGGMVYTADSGGVSHAYVSRLLGGVFSAPQQLDASGATQADITADNGGQLLVAFSGGGNLYVEETASSAQPLSSPQQLASGASNPSISMNLFGVGYVAYTQTDGGGDDVDVQYWNGSSWAPASPEAMNNTAGDVAGTGTDAPSIAAASDGEAIVAWGEGGHVYSRRVWGTATSVEIEQDDVASYSGYPEVAATSPQVGVGGDSSYPDIVFTESYNVGSSTQSRAMLTRLVAEDTRPAVAIDGLTPANTLDALAPQVAMGEVGRGIATADSGTVASGGLLGSTTTTPTTTTTTGTGTTTTTTKTTTTSTTTSTLGTVSTPTGQATEAPFNAEATVLGTNGAPGTPGSQQTTDGANPVATPAVFGETTSGLAWDSSSGGLSQIVLAYAADGVNIAAPVVISDASDGTIQNQDGLMLAGDNRGDAVVVWVQGLANGALSVYTEQLYTPETQPILDPNIVDATTSTPTLNWEASTEYWGAVNYTVMLNGTPLTNTTATSQQLGPLTDGTYSWGLVATNAAGNQVNSNTGKLIVDTFAPRLRLRLTGAPRVKSTQRLTLAYTDPPNPTETGATASGIKSITVSWGDGTKPVTSTKLVSTTHAYTKIGVYTLTVTVSDKVGNTTTLTRLVRVL